MHTSFNHLPAINQQDQLDYLVRIITDSLDVSAIIYIGSITSSTVIKSCFAPEGIEGNYQYEYDLLVIPPAGEMREDYELQDIIESRCRSYAHVNATVRSMDIIRDLLRKGSSFFHTVFSEGYLLYSNGQANLPFLTPAGIPANKSVKAEQDWDLLYQDAVRFLNGAEFYAGNRDLRHAVFMLHQAAERVCSAMIRVFTGLHTSTHNLNKLLRYTRLFSMEPSAIFPRNTPEEIHLFDLLFRGYSDARYRQSYEINENELEILLRRLHRLHQVAEGLCRRQLRAYALKEGKRDPLLKKITGGKVRPQNDNPPL
ncbi:HEPN domain-containing protein [Anseongella ginsenosidimutans]|nr:HEPN domain-containing protein [Anseongella ginsenosidimutans]